MLAMWTPRPQNPRLSLSPSRSLSPSLSPSRSLSPNLSPSRSLSLRRLKNR